MNILELSKQSVRTLVADRPRGWLRPMFITISPNPRVKHDTLKVSPSGKKVTVKLPYETLPQRLQYDYCRRIVERCYLPFLSKDSYVVGTWELNSSGNVHFHLLIDDPKIKNDTHIMMFRRDILNCEPVLRNIKPGKKMVDYMNNIVFVDKPISELVDYMDKDYDKNSDIFSNYLQYI